MTQILLVEDDVSLASILIGGFEAEECAVVHETDGLEAETRALDGAFDVLIVDWNLPGQSGRALTRALRQRGYEGGILMLTALGDVDHRVSGLDAGADDYVTKPFDFEELMARVRALVRRTEGRAASSPIAYGPLRIDQARLQAYLASHLLSLRTKEFHVLRVLAEQAEQVVSRHDLARAVWDDMFTRDNVIDVTLHGLRQSLRKAQSELRLDEAEQVSIKTVRGAGYRLERRSTDA